MREAARTFVDLLLGNELAQAARIPVIEGRDPFGIACDCIGPDGRDLIDSDGEVVCCLCARIFQ